MVTMELRKLDLSSTVEKDFVENLNIESFPRSERRFGSTSTDFWNNNPDYTIDLVVKKCNLVGFLTYWDLVDFIFAEHFAIAPEARNNGIGGKVMNLFMKKVNKPVILEVELPTTILSERRIGFYQRLGYKLWDDIPYLQPAYHDGDNPIPMKLMSIGDIDLNDDFGEIKDRIYRIVYNS